MATVAYKVLKQCRLSFEARLIEYSFAHSNIPLDIRLRVLDIGCGGSKLPIELANFGHEVYGIDAMPYHDQLNFTFVQGNLEHMPFDNDFFDIITAVSTIEHIGLGRYGDLISPHGDKTAVEEIRRIVKPGGKVIVTIPCGKDTICYSREGVPLGRVYSSTSLVELLSGFKILEMSYIVKKKGIWLPASMSEAEREVRYAKAEKVAMTSIALIVACKENQQ
jgi:SAM-dependent methyltransferase